MLSHNIDNTSQSSNSATFDYRNTDGSVKYQPRVPSGQGKPGKPGKGTVLEKVRENLEKSGNFCKIS